MSKYEPDSAPLADALYDIVTKTNCAESDPSLLLDILNDIIDTAEKAKLAYRDNVMAAQKAELDDLRAKAAEQVA